MNEEHLIPKAWVVLKIKVPKVYKNRNKLIDDLIDFLLVGHIDRDIHLDNLTDVPTNFVGNTKYAINFKISNENRLILKELFNNCATVNFTPNRFSYALNGQFSLLENWLVEHNIPFDRHTYPDKMVDSELFIFRPEIKDLTKYIKTCLPISSSHLMYFKTSEDTNINNFVYDPTLYSKIENLLLNYSAGAATAEDTLKLMAKHIPEPIIDLDKIP